MIELLIVVAIIGLLAAMLIPNLLDAMQKAKQKRTMAEARLIGGSMMAWLTDQATAGAAGKTVNMSSYTPVTATRLSSILVPQYIPDIPELDGWKKPYSYYLDTVPPHDRHVMGIRSAGRGNIFESNSYTAGAFEPTDYDQDIVWVDGFFVRWPMRLGTT